MKEFVAKHKKLIISILGVIAVLAASTQTAIDDIIVDKLIDVVSSVEVEATPEVEAE